MTPVQHTVGAAAGGRVLITFPLIGGERKIQAIALKYISGGMSNAVNSSPHPWGPNGEIVVRDVVANQYIMNGDDFSSVAARMSAQRDDPILYLYPHLDSVFTLQSSNLDYSIEIGHWEDVFSSFVEDNSGSTVFELYMKFGKL